MIKTLRSRWRSAYRARTLNRRTNHALNALDDRMLKDIGLCRSDLLALKHFQEPFRGPQPW